MNILTLEWQRTVGGCMVVGRKGGAQRKKGVDEQDVGIY
jgi:hypothetical protein